jgi:exportin-2 (importin alpha re-exporter)
MSDIPALLLASLNPQTRKQAEQSLQAYSTQQGFLPSLLHLVLSPAHDRSVRLAGSVYLKNTIKQRWPEDVRPVPIFPFIALTRRRKRARSRPSTKRRYVRSSSQL